MSWVSKTCWVAGCEYGSTLSHPFNSHTQAPDLVGTGNPRVSSVLRSGQVRFFSIFKCNLTINSH
jgi:hypothetical protein